MGVFRRNTAEKYFVYNSSQLKNIYLLHNCTKNYYFCSKELHNGKMQSNFLRRGNRLSRQIE